MMKKVFLSVSVFALMSGTVFAAHHGAVHSASKITQNSKQVTLAANTESPVPNHQAVPEVVKVQKAKQDVTAAETPAGNITSLDKIVAVVNNDVIMASEVNAQIEMAKKELAHGGGKMPSDSELKAKILDTVILTHLQLQIAKRAGVSISSVELDKAVESIAQRNNLDIEKFKMALSQSGIDYNQFRLQIEEQMLVARVQQQLLGHSINVSEAEIDSYLLAHKSKLEGKAARAEAEQIIFKNKFVERLGSWLKDLRASAYVKIMEE
jgi:parvulin-like peptidyl-prolyl isomerase